MSHMSSVEKLPEGVEAERKALETGVDTFAGGDVAKEAISALETPKFDSPMVPNDIGDNALEPTANGKHCAEVAPFIVPKTAEEIAAFFDSFNVDLTDFKFDRDEANER